MENKTLVKAKEGRTALMRVAMYGYTEIVELLLDKGVDIKAEDKYGGKTALQWAADNCTEPVQVLLDRRTSLEKAADDRTEIVELLLDKPKAT